MQDTLDLLVIGTGVAASTIAKRCRSAGWSVAVVDERPYGGTCQLRGCDPKKVLRRGAEIVDAVRQFREKGIDDPGVAIDWPELMRFKRGFTDSVPAYKEDSFAEQGIETLKGTARFVAADAVEINGEPIGARHIVIATGAEPVPLPIEGAEHLITSDRFMELENLPERVLFVGGGYISFEFAHLAARADAEVMILESGYRPLAAFDPDLVDKLLDRSREIGMDVRSSATVEAIERQGDGFLVKAAIDDAKQRFEVDLVVHGAGRVPALQRLDLEAGEVACEKSGVTVNEFLQSVSNPRVYAAGDAAGRGLPLTPVASLQADAVATNLLEGNSQEPDYTGVPSAVFTIPPLASVGLGEQEARDRNLDVEVKVSNMSGWYSLKRVGETHGGAKVLIERGSDRILGAHLLAPEASELINVFGLAMRSGLKAADLRNMVSAYPSALSDIGSLV